MNNLDFPRDAAAILWQASQLADMRERQAYLDRACAGQPELRIEVEQLLEALASAPIGQQPLVERLDAAAENGAGWSDFLTLLEGEGEKGKLASGIQGSNAANDPLLGDEVGPYKIRERLGEGGFGVVYVAEQRQPVRRQVALKVLKPGVGSQEVLARFAAEQQALAMMDHPCIAKVFDAGVMPNGSPFFVMELVRGIPITRFCDQARLKTEERLRLFIDVCHAIQHAHQKGIIHRDIKPGNVLVASHDGNPVVKVIDFGIAKAINQQLTEHSVYTKFAQLIGTPSYMSPEQAELNALNVDTRSDIYSLGVLIYELLTGNPPFDRERLKQVSFDEMRRIIREEDPSKPSLAVSTQGKAATTVSSNRGTEPGRLSQILQGELDWIVMKALAKDRSRRYETANEFATDIDRYLRNEPVEACPPSVAYKVSKFVQRHKVSVVAATLVLFGLLIGVAGTTWGMFRASESAEQERTAKLRALDEKHRAQAAEKAEREAHEIASRRLAQIVKTNEILTSIFDDLDPDLEKRDGRPLRAILGDRLVSVAEQLDSESIGDRLMVAEAQTRLASALSGLGLPKLALPLLQKATSTLTEELGKDDPLTLDCMNGLGGALIEVGENEQAVELLEETIQLQRQVLGFGHPETLKSMNSLGHAYTTMGEYPMAISVHERTLELRREKLGADDADTLTSMNNLAVAHMGNLDYQAAVPLLEEALALQEKLPGSRYFDRLATQTNLAGAYYMAGDHSKSIETFEKTLESQIAHLGRQHLETLTTLNNLANVKQSIGDSQAAIELLEETLTGFTDKLGPNHTSTLTCKSSLGHCYLQIGDNEKAVQLLKETLEIRQQELGPQHRNTLNNMNLLATAYYASGELEEARNLYEMTLKAQQSGLGPTHPSTVATMSNFAILLCAMDEGERAVELNEKVLELNRERLGPLHPATLLSMNNLAHAYQVSGEYERAIALNKETLEIRQTELGPKAFDTIISMGNLGTAYLANDEVTEAVNLLEQAFELKKELLGASHGTTLISINDLARAYVASGQANRAAQLYKETLVQLRNELPPESPRLASFLSKFGLMLLRSHRYAEAEPHLRECLAIREAAQPDNWTTFNAHSMLGRSLLGQKKYDEAEPLLLKGYEGMKHREESIPVEGRGRLTEVLLGLVELHELIDKKDEAAKWQAELDKRSIEQSPGNATLPVRSDH